MEKLTLIITETMNLFSLDLNKKTLSNIGPVRASCKEATLFLLYATDTGSRMHRTDKYSQHSSIIWPVLLNGLVFVYERSGCGFESSCSHLNFRFCACFEQGVP